MQILSRFMKTKWLRWFDIVVVAILVGLISLYFAIPEYRFYFGWKKEQPPKGQYYVFCKMRHIDRHMFNNVANHFKFPGKSPSRCSYTQSHLLGHRGLIQRVKQDEGKSAQEFTDLLQEFIDEYADWYLRERLDGKPGIEIETYIISSEGKIYYLPQCEPKNEDEK